MIPWWWLLVALVVGALLVPAFYAIVGFLATGFSKNIGPGGCHVCSHAPQWGIGEHTKWRHWFENARHRWLWANRAGHKRAWAAHRWNKAWNPKGKSFDLSCSECPDVNFPVRGPYSDARAAAFPARDHEIAFHRGVHTVTIEERTR